VNNILNFNKDESEDSAHTVDEGDRLNPHLMDGLTDEERSEALVRQMQDEEDRENEEVARRMQDEM